MLANRSNSKAPKFGFSIAAVALLSAGLALAAESTIQGKVGPSREADCAIYTNYNTFEVKDTTDAGVNLCALDGKRLFITGEISATVDGHIWIEVASYSAEDPAAAAE